MSFNLRYLFLLFISINLFADIGNRFIPNKLQNDNRINKYVDYYFLNKAKTKINYLSHRVKWSLLGTKNDSLNDIDILTLRNSNLVDLTSNIIDGNRTLSNREVTLLRVIDDISNALQNSGDLEEEITCDRLASHSRATTSVFLNGSLEGPLSEDECEALNKKFLNYYQLGPYSIRELNGTIIAQYRGRIYLDEFDEHERLSQKSKGSLKELYSLRDSISVLFEDELLLLAQGLSLRGFTQKQMIADAIIERTNWLLNPTNCPTCNIIVLNQALTLANGYSFTPYTIGEQNLSSSTALSVADLIAQLNARVDALQDEIDDINSSITTLSAEQVSVSATLQTCRNNCDSTWSSSGSALVQACYTADCGSYQTRFDELAPLISEKESQILTLQARINEYQNLIANPSLIVIEDFSSDLTQLITDRVSENITYGILQKINFLQNNIEEYILFNGRAPNRINIIAESATDIITASWWPKMFDNNGTNNISINVDLNKSVVTYSNIFSNRMIDALDRFSMRIVQNFRKNIAFPINGSVIQDVSQFDLIIPLRRDVTRFVREVQQIETLRLSGKDIVVQRRPSNNLCTSSTENRVLYEPDRTGGFDIYQCVAFVVPLYRWESIHLISSKNNLDINSSTVYRDTNTTYSIFTSHGSSGELIYEDLNSTHSQKGILLDGVFRRIIN